MFPLPDGCSPEFRRTISLGLLVLQPSALSKLADAADANLASEFHKRLMNRVRAFEATLDPEQEVGVRLVSFGQTVTLHARSIGFVNPSLIVFIGETEDPQPIQLVQHVSQVNLLLTCVPKLKPEEPSRVFGFGQVFE
jgi:hypothetical protein